MGILRWKSSLSENAKLLEPERFLELGRFGDPPAKCRQRFPWKPAWLPGRLSLASPSGLPGSADPGLLHHLDRFGVGALRARSSKAACSRINNPRAYRLLVPGLGAVKAQCSQKPSSRLCGRELHAPWHPGL